MSKGRFTSREKLKKSANNSLQIDVPITAFDELLIAEFTPTVQLHFHYNINPALVDVVNVSGGTVTQSDSMAVVGSSTTTGSTALMTSHNFVRGSAGQGVRARFDAIFTIGVSGTNQEIGLGDAVNGFFIGVNGEDFSINRRRDGTDNFVSQSNFNRDKLDGTGPSEMVIDTTKLNSFEISYQGAINYCLANPVTGDIILFHRIEYGNNNIIPHVLNTTAPMRVFVDNSATTSDIVIKTSFISGGIEGKNAELGFIESFSSTVNSVPAGVETLVFSLKNKETFSSKTNRGIVRALTISAAVSGTKTAIVRLYVGTTLTAPSFSDLDTGVSMIEMDTSATGFSGGTQVFALPLSKEGNALEDVSKLEGDLLPGIVSSITVESANSTDVAAAIVWKELF